jgi:uncharacterized protein YkwD
MIRAMNLNLLDFALIVIVLLSVFSGWQRGFIFGMLDLVRWVGSLIAGLFLYQTVSENFISPLEWWSEIWDEPVSFLLVVIFASITIQLIGNAILRRIPRDAHKRQANRALGVLPGAANGLITAMILATVFLALPLAGSFGESVRESALVNRLAVFSEELESRLAPIFHEAITQTLNRRTTVHPGSEERVALPFKIENSRPRPEIEARMLELVNRERAAAGLAPLELDPELTETARKHSADMFERGYFSHYTPENASPFDRMRADGVRYLTAGENLALAPTVQIAHTGLMNSPGHRANILRAQFGRVGIGIMDGGWRGLMVTQNFRN